MVSQSLAMSRSLPSLIRCSSKSMRSTDGLMSYLNAAIAKLGSVAKTTEEVFDDILNANFRGAYFTV